MFDIADCDGSTMVIMDYCEQVQVDQVNNCRVFVGACASSIFIRNCSNSTFYTCCRQLRLRDCVNCKFYIYSMSEVHIELSRDLLFAPFNGGYPDHATHLAKAKLDISNNLWYDIFDHNDPGKTHANWALLPESAYEPEWFPQGPCAPAISKNAPGSVARLGSDSAMHSYGIEQMKADAEKLKAQSQAHVATSAVLPPPPTTVSVSLPPVPPSLTKIAIIGSGAVASALAGGLLKSGKFEVAFGSRNPSSDKVQALLTAYPSATSWGIEAATAGADVIILAVPGMRTLEEYSECAKSLGGGAKSKVITMCVL